MTDVSGERLRELVVYRDGALYWRVPNARQAMGAVGTPNTDGRLQVRVEGVRWFVHRLVWLYHFDEFPAGQIDHRNGDFRDNRLANLRVVTASENRQNRREIGVSRRPSGYWQARIMVAGRRQSLGCFVARSDAERVYQEAKLRLHPAFASGVGAVI